MKARTALKWAIGVVAIVLLIGVGGVVWLCVAAFMSLEKGEQHRRQLQAEQDSGRWDFGDQPALFSVAQGIVKNDPQAIRTAAKGMPDLPLLLYRMAMGLDDNLAYADALLLLQRGADPNRAAVDGMTFGKMLKDHWAHFQRTHKSPPAEFAALWDWAGQHGIVQQTP